MNTFSIKSFLTGICVVLLLTGCQDDDDLFTGQDNFITSFSLKQDGTTYHASFYGDSIIVTVPENLSLNGATVICTLSEQASIIPDPAAVTKWDEEMLFTVTSWNGMRKTYRYTVNRNSIDAEGTVVLSTQEEVDAFGEQGITSIRGNLVIGRKAGTDSITSLTALYQLKTVAYSVIINPTYAGSEFVGFDALEAVGGEINIESNRNLKTIEFPRLVTAGSISVKSDSITAVRFPELAVGMNSLTVDCPLSTAHFANLKSVGGQLSLLHSYNMGEITEISLPALKEAGSLNIARFTKALSLDLPELETTGDFYMLALSSLKYIYCPNLKQINGILTVPDGNTLTELSFPKLEKATGLKIYGKSMLVLEFPSLTEVTNDLYMQFLPLANLDGFKSLVSVGGAFSIIKFSKLTSFSVPPKLKHVGKLYLSYYDTTPPEEINIKGLDVGELALGGALINMKVIGDDEFAGTLTIETSSLPTGKTATFPELEGFSTVDSLSFGGYVYSSMPLVNVKGIRKIKKGFHLPNGDPTQFRMPDLEEVGGDFIINHLNRVTDQTVEIPSLKTIAGNFDVQILSTSVSTLSFPALESVGGSFKLSTGYDTRSLTSALFPSLETIGGTLALYAYSGSSSYVNTKMTGLDGFSALTSVHGIEITKQSVLVSYEGLKKALSSFTASGWSASGNAYNPTYEELAAGQWVKP